MLGIKGIRRIKEFRAHRTSHLQCSLRLSPRPHPSQATGRFGRKAERETSPEKDYTPETDAGPGVGWSSTAKTHGPGSPCHCRGRERRVDDR